VRTGRWKGIRTNVVQQPDGPIELYDLERDRGETRNVAVAHAEVARRIATIMKSSHTPAVLPKWNFTAASSAR
jgi:hypothetical protein